MEVGELRHPGRHLGEQGQEVPWTIDRPSLVPFEGHKATEKTEYNGDLEGAHGPGSLHPSIQLTTQEALEGQLPEGGMEAQ